MAFENISNAIENWPKLPNGEYEKPVFLCHLRCNDMMDELRINMLNSYGIPCLKQYPGDGTFGHVVLGMSGNGTDIYVPESLYNDAVELCKEENSDE